MLSVKLEPSTVKVLVAEAEPSQVIKELKEDRLVVIDCEKKLLNENKQKIKKNKSLIFFINKNNPIEYLIK